jgi:endonuclease III
VLIIISIIFINAKYAKVVYNNLISKYHLLKTFMNINRLNYIINTLGDYYGRYKLIPHYNPIDELIKTILSQNTSDSNSIPAYESLISRYQNREDIISADIKELELLIRRGGLAHIKSERIKEVLNIIKDKVGRLDLNFLQNLSVEQGRMWLTSLPGVGVKTANCVLLFALGKPALPVDTHVFRVSVRLGFISRNTTITKAHIELENIIVSANYIYEFHLLMIEHGRKVCSARKPLCEFCIINSNCPYYKELRNKV